MKEQRNHGNNEYKDILDINNNNMEEVVEIWKDIPEYNDYQVSNIGRVKSLKFGKERILKSGICGNGYYMVILYKNKKKIHFKVHQLIAMAFLNHIPDGTNKIVVDHINENKLDNRLENLQLISNRENTVRSLTGVYSSTYTGVCWYKRYNKWKSKIQINKKTINLGYFEDEYEASETYQKALKNIHLYNGCNKTFRKIIKNKNK